MEQTAEIYPLDRSRREQYRPQPVDLAAPDAFSFDLFALLWRRKSMLIGTIIVVTVFSVLAAFQITPRFEASVRLMIGNSGTQQLGALRQVLGGGDGLSSEIYGELEIMQSDRLIETAVAQLGLVDDPEFNKSVLGRWGERMSSIPFLKSFIGMLENPPPRVLIPERPSAYYRFVRPTRREPPRWRVLGAPCCPRYRCRRTYWRAVRLFSGRST